MTIALLGTDMCLYALAGSHPRLRERLEDREPGSVAISAVTLAEIALGSANGKAPPVEVLDAFVEQIILLDFDGAAAWAYASLPFRRGRFDRLLGAHALSLGAVLVTDNERDFADIPGLQIENWTL
ncbi:type II toxin-antitoxin system VapC family toxin [Sphingomonas canadensis]|uniref:Type II toxin-antitoxin system VapC family toxin n=1 Tax=Sphingomonas canadensis TaxID=1219257 RepID=A0ABW3H302_9SPHN|nr:type II toxin-antitoxin system VapC family toxin [Sphingomonas canadensis]MCW3835692.1 type II toxin-antitoxin system VapC family toxin [Sphingomonas canadensis]